MPGLKLSWNEFDSSRVEALLSRGDRRIGDVIERAWQLGTRFDGWRECFRYECWMRAMAERGLDIEWYVHRERTLDETLPWSHIHAGVDGAFLWEEWQKALDASTTDDCRYGKCVRCGTNPVDCGDAHRIRKTIRVELKRERRAVAT
jgi:hypothetical protein